MNSPSRPWSNTEPTGYGPPRPMALLMGSAHQACMRLSASVTAMAARPVSASLTASHRVRVMLWVQARASVRVSNSWAISGAPPEDADDRGRGEDEPDAEHVDGWVGAGGGQPAEERVSRVRAGAAVAAGDRAGVQAGQVRPGEHH